MFTTGEGDEYVSEKAETNKGWIFPVGDELHELGYNFMFTDMFDAMDKGTTPIETFYDGYVVNAIMDAAYQSAKSKKWGRSSSKFGEAKKAFPNCHPSANMMKITI